MWAPDLLPPGNMVPPPPLQRQPAPHAARPRGELRRRRRAEAARGNGHRRALTRGPGAGTWGGTGAAGALRVRATNTS